MADPGLNERGGLEGEYACKRNALFAVIPTFAYVDIWYIHNSACYVIDQ